jgi:diguanylate cyclase (GGDEF)-like protein
MMKNYAEKLQHWRLKVVLSLFLVVTIAMVIEIFIVNSLNKKNLNKTSLVLLNQVVGVIEDNEENENELISTLKEDYIIRAQTVAYILDSKPDAEYDIEELQKIAGMMQIDEIHLFDENGEIYSGTEPKYYGFNFDSGEQISYFKPMLSDKTLTMCQDVTPNTAEGKSMMYAITWNEAGDKMIQVGIEPLRLLEELRSNEISEVIANMPAYDGVSILTAAADSGEIYGSTDSGLIGKTLDEVGITEINADIGVTSSKTFQIDGYRNYCNYTRTGDYIVVVACSAGTSIKNSMVAIAIELVYLVLAGLVIGYMMKRVLKADDEKNTQMAVLVSMSDIYNSMHLIDLEKNTVVEYNVREELSKAVDHTYGADEMMEQIMSMITDEENLAETLNFTDVHTLADRMKNKKIISQELVSNAIGWYRASFISIDTDKDGYPTKVIYVTQNIDKMKKKEEELIHISNVDELTGLYNRHAYEEDIAGYDDTVPEENFVFVSFDVNGLKRVNDTKGHIAGDELLTGAADCMKSCFGSHGKIYRVGGDEFAAIISVNESQLENIKKDFQNIISKWSGKLAGSLSISCGYVTATEAGSVSVREMAELADKRMYEEKTKYYAKGYKR